MAFQDIVQRLTREMPGLNVAYAKTIVNEALKQIYRSRMWSFQLKEGGWLSPGLLFSINAPLGGAGQSGGTISATAGNTYVTGNATASALWLAYIQALTQPYLTQCQIRVPYFSLYNIISFDTSNPSAIKLNLDRAWQEPTNATYSYMIYQAYFPAPYALNDFKRWFQIRNTSHNQYLDFWSIKQPDLAVRDPQRVVFNYPQYVVPYEVDARPGSSTLGHMLYELWPQPLSQWPFSFQCMRLGPTLTSPNDEVPAPLTEEIVDWRAREVLAIWQEQQKGQDVQRGSGANWAFVAQASQAEYKELMKSIALQDRSLCNLYFATIYKRSAEIGQPYATINSQLNVGNL